MTDVEIQVIFFSRGIGQVCLSQINIKMFSKEIDRVPHLMGGRMHERINVNMKVLISNDCLCTDEKLCVNNITLF